jgi:hypothetical protein
MEFWQQPEWIKMKTYIAKTDKMLSKVEYLKLVGWQNYSEEKYRKYLEVMAEPEEITFDELEDII